MIPKFLRADYRSELVRRRRHQCVTRELRVRRHFGLVPRATQACGVVVRDCRAASPGEPPCCNANDVRRRYSRPNVAVPFIDHSSEVWNFLCDELGPSGKVKP
jgi:hypothetical protein